MTIPVCRLRPVEPDDVPIFYDHQADVGAATTAAVPSRNRADHRAHWVMLLDDSDVTVRTVLVPTPDGEAVAGNVLTFLRNGQREVGYWLGRAFWGRGVATAALRLFLTEYAERPLVACVATPNRPSATVLLHNGFRELAPVTAEDGLKLRQFLLAQESSSARNARRDHRVDRWSCGEP